MSLVYLPIRPTLRWNVFPPTLDNFIYEGGWRRVVVKFLQHPRNVRGYRGNGVSCGISIFLVDQDAFRARLIFKEFWGGGGERRHGMDEFYK